MAPVKNAHPTACFPIIAIVLDSITDKTNNPTTINTTTHFTFFILHHHLTRSFWVH